VSIDARVHGVVLASEDETVLLLDQPDPSRVAGQRQLVVEPPVPPNVGLLFMQSVWGGADSLVLGETVIGRRHGYTRVTLDGAAIDEALRLKATRPTGVAGA
jgi:hypothetical protein